MSDTKQIDCFLFATEDTYETAKREKIVIEKIRKKYDVRNKQVALKIYRKAVKDNSFSTLVGYAFLEELYHNMEIAGVNVEELPPAFSEKKEEGEKESSSFPNRIHKNAQERKNSKWKLLYEGQKRINKRYKIAIAMLVILILSLFVIEYKSQYSIFTYFTDYKSKMEQELIDQYENWEEQLQQREDALQQREDALNGGTENGTENSSR